MFKRRILTITAVVMLASAAFATTVIAAPVPSSCELPQCTYENCQNTGRHYHNDVYYCGQGDGCDGNTCQSTQSGQGHHRSSGTRHGHGCH